MATANSVMRLMADGTEQPIDTYVKYKNDISLWYQEMRDYGLTEDEIVTLEKHLKIVYGVADTQEIVMELCMDDKVANFSIAEANKLRKAIAKKKKDVLQSVKELFYEKGKEIGTSETLLHYVWDIQIHRQIGYSFSKNHTFPYSCIGLQELNLAYHYPKIYWNTACLSVNAGANEDNENNKGTDYGKIAQAIGHMQGRGVTVALPNVNSAGFGFKPDIENGRIIFGLKGINGIGDEVVHAIIKGRPYDSFDDFLQKMVFIENSTVKNGHMIQLIKAGAFDELEKNVSREDLLRRFVTIISEPKSKLTMQNFQMLINHDLVPQQYALEVRFFNYRKYIFKSKPFKVIKNTNPKVKKKIDDELYLLDDISTEFYLEHFDEDRVVEYVGSNLVISKKEFDKEYKEKVVNIGEWLKHKSVLEALNSALFEEAWEKYAKGTISTWEMESISYYYHEHELTPLNREKYNIANFFELEEEPHIVGWNKYRGRKIPKFEIYRIAGTVLDRDKQKHTVSLLTPEGVVTVKMYSGAFGHYDKQISKRNPDGTKTILESSWFTRGNKILVVGYRKDKQFKPRVYKDTVYNHTIALIKDIDDKGNVLLQTERVQES